MDKISTSMWDYSKIVEEDKDGKLHLVESNLAKLLELLKNDQDSSKKQTIEIISCVGPHQCEKSFITNLIPLYLKHHSKGFAWATAIKETGLKGFAFGKVNNLETDKVEVDEAKLNNLVVDNASQTDADIDNTKVHSNEPQEPSREDITITDKNTDNTKEIQERQELKNQSGKPTVSNTETENELRLLRYYANDILRLDIKLEAYDDDTCRTPVANFVKAAKDILAYTRILDTCQNEFDLTDTKPNQESCVSTPQESTSSMQEDLTASIVAFKETTESNDNTDCVSCSQISANDNHKIPQSILSYNRTFHTQDSFLSEKPNDETLADNDDPKFEGVAATNAEIEKAMVDIPDQTKVTFENMLKPIASGEESNSKVEEISDNNASASSADVRYEVDEEQDVLKEQSSLEEVIVVPSSSITLLQRSDETLKKNDREDETVVTSKSSSGKIPSIKSDLFYPGSEEANGIYLWPDWIPICNGTKKLAILYLHQNLPPINESTERKISLLNLFLGFVSTTIINIINDETSEISVIRSFLSEKAHSDLKYDLCGTVIHIENITAIVGVPSLNQGDAGESKLENYFRLHKPISLAHDGTGKLDIPSKECRTIKDFLARVTDSVNYTTTTCSNPLISAATFKKHLTEIISEVNECIDLKVKTPKRNEASSLVRSSPKIIDNRLNENSNASQETASPIKPHTLKTDESRQKIQAKRSNVIEHPLSQEKVKDDTDKMAEKVVRETLLSIWKELEESLIVFINNDLKITNISQIPKLYDIWEENFNKTKLRSASGQLSSVDSDKVFKKIKEKANNSFRPILREITSKLKEFCKHVNEQFKVNITLFSKDLDNLLQAEMCGILNLVEYKESKQVIEISCLKLMTEIISINKARQEFEEMFLQNIINRLGNFYKETMTYLFSPKALHDPIVLSKVHNSLSHELTTVLKSCLGNVHRETDISKHLCHQLLNIFQEFSNSNMNRLESMQKSIKSIVAKYKSEYEVEIDSLMNDNKYGIEPRQFTISHKQKRNECCDKLRSTIKKEAGQDEPVEKYIGPFQMLLEKSFEAFSEENTEKYKKGEENNMVNLDSNEYGNATSGATASTTYTTASNSTQQGESLRRPQPPVIFQLNYFKICVGFEGLEDSDSSNDSQCSTIHDATVALSETNEWFCGNEVQKQQDGNRMSFKKIWRLKDILSPYSWSEEINLEGGSYKITSDFIISIFFRAFKQDFQNEFGGQISQAIVSVPFWFSCAIRIKLENAALIAGFKEVYIVNENSAAAFFWYSNGLANLNNTVVISENSTRVDISLYSYDQQINKVSLLGHSGDYQIDEIPKGYKIVEFVSGILLSLVNGLADEKVENEATKNLTELWNLALSSASKNNPKLKFKSRCVLICCESDKWKKLLWSLGNNITTKDLVQVRNDAVIRGLFALSKSLLAVKDRSLKYLIRDGMPSNVVVKSPQKTFLIMKKIDTFSVSGSRLETVRIPVNKELYIFSQENSIEIVHFGYLTVNNVPQNVKFIEFTLRRTLNCVMVLEKINFVNSSNVKLQSFDRPFSTDYFEWWCFELDKDTLKDSISLITKLLIHTGHSKKNLVVEKAIRYAHSLKEAISTGKGSFKSNVGKNMALDAVNDALTILQKKNLTDSDVQRQNDLVINLARKHNIEFDK